MTTTTTAAEYAERYREAYESRALVQGDWHSEQDGRTVACALGVIGEEVDSPRKCPARIMPRWLAQLVPSLFDRQKEADAFMWGLAFTNELARLDGQVPFSVVHDWLANTVCQLGIDAAEKRGHDPAPHKALQALHLRALGGETITADEWPPVLKNANASAYAYAYTYADTYTDANAYTYANVYTRVYAEANANVYAYAYADDDAYAYTDDDDDAYTNAWKLLADGMVAALKRVPTEQVQS